MPSLTLDRVWVHDGDDLTVHVSFFSGSRGDVRQVSGEVRTYAGGRRRVITRAGRRQALSVTLRLVDAASLATLDGWLGRVVMVRDKVGRLVFGVYHALDVVDHPDSGHDITFDLEQVTVSIEV